MRDIIGPGLGPLHSSHLTSAAATVALALSVYMYLRPAFTRDPSAPGPKPPAPSPRTTILPNLPDPADRDALPYPPDLLPGGRDVDTPYGNLRVYEWGPESGERVLLLHGIGTPCLALGEMAGELVKQGFRVMLFDFFGRGYSDAPTDLPYDSRLYVAQVHLALASSASKPGWSGADAFHLVGYSLGGAVAASFARYHPHSARSLTLVATGGLLRPHRVSWDSRLLYSEGYLPGWLSRGLIWRRLWPLCEGPSGAWARKELGRRAEKADRVADDDDGAGDGGEYGSAPDGSAFDGAGLASARPDLRVSRVMAWQLLYHAGFVPAYKSTIIHAPVYGQGNKEWEPLRGILEARRISGSGSTQGPEEGRPPPGLTGGKVLFVLGETDTVVVPGETEADAKKVLGDNAVAVEIVKGVGHELGITKGRDIAGMAVKFWRDTGASEIGME